MATNDKDFWSKPDHLKAKPKATSKAAPKAASKTAPKSSPTPKKPKSPKPPLTKVGILLRAVKHSVIMVVLLILGAVGAHYFLTMVTRHGVHCTVPSFEALTMDEARNLAAKDELELIINDSLYAPNYAGGVILDQLPKSGVVVKPGRAIYLTVNATQRRMVDMPFVAERSLRQARNMLEMAGLTIDSLEYVDDMASNYVLSQIFEGKAVKVGGSLRVPAGSSVTLQVGRGVDDQTITPLLVGRSLRDAKSVLWSVGLNIGDVEFVDGSDLSSQAKARIFWQSNRSESENRFGERVAVKLAADPQCIDSMTRLYYEQLKAEDDAILEQQRVIDSLANAIKMGVVEQIEE